MFDIYFTSFKRSANLDSGIQKFSCAVYQPKGFDYPKVNWTDIRKNGTWIRPREFLDQDNPTEGYRKALLSLYGSRIFEAEVWLASLSSRAALCCWCPYDQAAQRQLKEYGSFICHTAVLAEFLSTNFKVNVWLDNDRLSLTTLTQDWSKR